LGKTAKHRKFYFSQMIILQVYQLTFPLPIWYWLYLFLKCFLFYFLIFRYWWKWWFNWQLTDKMSQRCRLTKAKILILGSEGVGKTGGWNFEQQVFMMLLATATTQISWPLL